MPCVWLQHNKSQLFMNVGVLDASHVQDLISTEVSIDDFNIGNQMFKALVDTGAQKTMVSKAAAEKVGLRPIGTVPVMGVGGVSQHQNYLFHIAFVLRVQLSGDAREEVAAIHTLPDPIEGAELDLEGAGFDVLLGMDILSTGSLAVEGSGTYSFSF